MGGNQRIVRGHHARICKMFLQSSENEKDLPYNYDDDDDHYDDEDEDE